MNKLFEKLSGLVSTENMAESLEFLIVGMLGIFAVIGVIILVTVLLNKIFSAKDGTTPKQ